MRKLSLVAVIACSQPLWLSSSSARAQEPCSACDEWWDMFQAQWFHANGLDGTWDWKCGAPGAQCHGGAGYDRCADHHVACTGSLSAAHARSVIDGKDLNSIADMLARNPKHARLNVERSSIQLRTCTGKVYANLQVPRSMTAALATRSIVAVAMR